ncbi:DUF4926 domain-containing protein [Aquincola sp. S2]|uniref:DUF4926 domain-containing protein n=1 Tax=Pseudaquabacterium terrae TaxID=2732868 RepID=A0ABX2EGX7_9BURK|nr:DUF4926 domain-containing protein [Aquabacterium terrae]
MLGAFRQYDTVRVKALHEDRFAFDPPVHQRHPRIGDVGTIVGVYSHPTVGYEVECSDPNTGFTIWLEAMHPDEVEPA